VCAVPSDCAGRLDYEAHATTLDAFRAFVERTADAAGGELEAFAERWCRARTGIVLTAHPTFALSDGLYRRMTEIAVADAGMTATCRSAWRIVPSRT
jgi:phosphoenolpyruvate carboxylase